MSDYDDAGRITAALIGAGYVKHTSGETPKAAKEAAANEAVDLFKMVLEKLIALERARPTRKPL